MDRNRKKEGFLEKTAQLLEVPGQVVGLPKVELIGQGELRMENHRGILAYGREEILVSGGKLLIRVKGTQLELKAMNAGELLITGTILAVELE
ncbi:YabP/YqfC family sporulation protein [Vermiculatibacterium agrestimuris]|uniref:YabP/YqfC family sporulation protein n=1 Tax=Vermiculatibacterium agrestimuris TaxID=2941519 RepID=UPI00203F015E|nr:YabP/YqfC family sporulation protein [Vermiculatibacterium agrestimuris]